MKLKLLIFLFLVAGLTHSENTFAGSADTTIRMKDMLKTAWALRKQFKEIKGLYKYIKEEHEDLLSIKGQHLQIGYSYFGVHALEAGISKGKRDVMKISKYSNWHLLGMYLTTPVTQYGGLNFGYTSSGLFTCKSVETMLITNGSGKTDFIVRPEIGLTFLGSVNLSYGYNFTLGKQDISDINPHTIHLKFTFQSLKKNLVLKFHSIRYVLEKDADRLKSLGIPMPDLKFLYKY